MNRIGIGTTFILTGVVGLIVAPAAAQWVEFENQSASRVVADDIVGLSDTQERDYDWADLNNSGWIDLVAMRKQPFTTSGKRRNVLFMNEQGTLVDRSAEYASASDVPGDQGFLTPTNDRDVRIFDSDNNGWLDFVTATTLSDGDPKHISHPRLYKNQGNDGGGNWQGFIFENDRIPTFVCCNGSVPHAPRFCAVDAADVNGDGFSDIYFGDYDSGGFQTLDLNDRLVINDGNGFFTDESWRIPSAWLASVFTTAVIIDDFNQNGVNDIIRVNSLGAYDVRAFYNDTSNEGNYVQNQHIEGASPYFANAADLNNNGRLDLVVARDGTDRVFNNAGNVVGQVNWANPFTLPNSSGFRSNITIADLNNDGWKDIIIANLDVDIQNYGSHARVYRNQQTSPNATFAEDYGNQSSGTFQNTFDTAAFDINGDGWIDLVVARGSTGGGTTVLINQPPFSISYDYPQGLPATAQPEETTEIVVDVNALGADIAAVELIASVDGGPFESFPMSNVEGSTFVASLPLLECGQTASFYIQGELEGGFSVTDPPNAPDATFTVTAFAGTEVTFEDNMNQATEQWTVSSDPSLTTGEWQQVHPLAVDYLGDLASPDGDASPSADGMAFITQQCDPKDAPNECAVQFGPTYLTSPIIDLAGTDATISYARWFYCEHEGYAPREDFLTTEVSNDGGQSWVFVHDTGGTDQQWETVEFLVSNYVEPTSQVVVRFSVDDSEGSSVTNAGIDKFSVEEWVCEFSEPCPGDLNGDDVINVSDLLLMLGQFGACPGGCDADLNGDEVVNVSDLLLMLGQFGACPE